MNTEIGIKNNLKKFKASFLNFESRKTFSFDLGIQFEKIYKEIATFWNKNPNRIRIWNVHNGSLLNAFDKKEKLKKSENNCWFVQDIPESEEIIVDENHFVAFICFYIPESSQKLFYLGSHLFHLTDKISQIENIVSQKYFTKFFHMNSFIFKEDKMIPLSKNNSSTFIENLCVYNGVFLVVQSQDRNDISVKEFNSNVMIEDQFENDKNEIDIIEYNDMKEANFNFADSYIIYHLNKIDFYIYNFSTPDKPILKITIQKESTILHLRNLIALNLGIDYDNDKDSLLFFDHSNSNKFLDEYILNIILQKGNSKNNLSYLIFKGIKINESDIIKINIQYNKKKIKFIINKNEPLKMIKNHLSDNNIIPNDYKNLRFYLVYQSRIISILSDNDTIVNEKYVLNIEEIPVFQRRDDIVIVRIANCIKDGNELAFFGIPFLVGIEFDESCLILKEKICSLIECESKNFNVLIKIDDGSDDHYRCLNDTDNVLDVLDGKNELFALFCS